MKIGITERGDAGLDLTWVNSLPKVDGVVLITKNLNDRFIHKVVESYRKGYKIVVHATCTGFGGTSLEPYVPSPYFQLVQLKKLIDSGFPKSNCVLRIDPIIPVTQCLPYACQVIERGYTLGLLPGMRIRISILDEYKHVKDRLGRLGYSPFYPKGNLYPSSQMIDNVIMTLRRYPELRYECCAEDELAARAPDIVEPLGCISQKELTLWHFPIDTLGTNPQGRRGCHCLSSKVELLTNKCRCPHQCVYCYWKDSY